MILKEKIVTTKMPHACRLCTRRIPPNTKAFAFAELKDKEFEAGWMHLDCRDDHRATH